MNDRSFSDAPPIRSPRVLTGLTRTLYGAVRDHPHASAGEYRRLVCARYVDRGWPPVPINWSVRGSLNYLVAAGDLVEVEIDGTTRWHITPKPEGNTP